MGRAEPGDSPPIINERGGVWAVSGQVKVVWAITKPDVNNLHTHMNSKLSLLLAWGTRSWKNLFEVAEGLDYLFFWMCFKLTRGNRPYLQGEIVFPIFFPWCSFGHKVSELLSSIIKVPHGALGCSWGSCSSAEIDSTFASWLGS
jgi:hypothetical protein